MIPSLHWNPDFSIISSTVSVGKVGLVVDRSQLEREAKETRSPGQWRWWGRLQGEKKERVVCDYIAGMTDRYAIAKFEEYFMPKAWQVN